LNADADRDTLEFMYKHLFRPSVLIALSAAIVVGAVVVVFQGTPTQNFPKPLPVEPGEMEIVWLYTATNATSWERFVAAVRQTEEQLRRDRPGLHADLSAAFPQQTTAVPQVSLSLPGGGPRFVFRWYKLTSDWKTRDWIEALLKRPRPPLAIIGGSSSDGARELAFHLNQLGATIAEKDRPLLLLTTATADHVAPYEDKEVVPALASNGKPGDADSTGGVSLTQLYPGRTFRFCFTNKQMATAVSNFIWSRDDLRPDKDPLYVAMWNDDSYSRDLSDAFLGAFHEVVVRDVASYCTSWSSQTVFSWPPGLIGGILPVQRLPFDASKELLGSSLYFKVPSIPHVIDSSVGSFGTPNRCEANVAWKMLNSLIEDAPRRPLLIVTGQSQPTRRFLRGVIRSAPFLGGPDRLVVATGDAISFNTVYRDRQVAWNVQDLPFTLVFFCHHNPIDESAGFRQRVERANSVDSEDRDTASTTGTEDVLLFGDIVNAVLQRGAPKDEPPCSDAAQLAERIANVCLQDDRIVTGNKGIRLFTPDGERQSGTGEHIVFLQPMWNEAKDLLAAKATIEVWTWQRRDWSRGETGQHWQRRGEPLIVTYSDTPQEGGSASDER
jgi:hypothetical protein